MTNIFKNKYVRISLAFIVLIVLAGGAIAGVVLLNQTFFHGNPRFALKSIAVESVGWWNGRSSRVASDLDLHPGSTNVFALNLAKLRADLLKKEPSVKNVRVARILPDTLSFTITERIPRASLGDANSPWVVNEEGVVMSSHSCIDLRGELPVIIDLPKHLNVVSGARLEELEPALELIMLTKRKFQEFKIAKISLKKGGELNVALFYQDAPYGVTMPRENLEFLLGKLRLALRQATLRNDQKHRVNLLCDGQVIFDSLKSLRQD